jgi:hypothetical protein
VLTRRGHGGRDVATAVMLIDAPESGSTAVPLYSCLLGLTAESVYGALRAPFRRVQKFITHAAAANAFTKRGNTASPSSASSSSSSPLVTLALEEPLLAPPAPFKAFRAAAFLGD